MWLKSPDSLGLKVVVIYKIHIKETNIKNKVCGNFDNLIRSKKLETKNILICQKSTRVC